MNENEANAMVKFLNGFKKQVFDMTNNGNGGRFHLSSPFTNGFPLHNYEVLLPYWEELADALRSPRFIDCVASNDHSSFHLSDIYVGEELMDIMAPVETEVMDMLVNGVRMNSFRSMWFDNNHFGNTGIWFVIHGIENNNQLETLFIMNNPIEKSEDVFRLCSVIKHKTSLKRLVIKNCGGEDTSILSPIITASNTLEMLKMERNGISSFGSTGIPDFLSTNPSLKNLDLKGNRLNDEDAVLIASALESNTTLRDLDLSSNLITSAGKEVLLKRIFDPETLNTVTDCNHTCQIRVRAAFDEGSELPQINGMYGHPKLDRQMNLLSLLPNTVKNLKVLAMLSAPHERVVNIHYLNGLPLGLMPTVLEFVQQYPDPYYAFPDGINSQDHWYSLSALRPDTPQNEDEVNANGNEGGNDEQEEVVGENEEGILDDRHYWPTDDDSQQEMDPKPAQMKRLNMVFEIMRDWKMETGEPLYIFASSYNGMAHS